VVLGQQDSAEVLWPSRRRRCRYDTYPHQLPGEKSANFVCRLVQHHHAKVIWWRGVGVYIGSANLTGSAWYKNVEAGCFFSEEEITDEMAGDILAMFKVLEEHATPLTEELLEEMKLRERSLAAAVPDAKDFWGSPTSLGGPAWFTRERPTPAAEGARIS
jgi:phosphatidylserine/phosphatidylglycerophosphate/cardiolipin synthase-like enzyme